MRSLKSTLQQWLQITTPHLVTNPDEAKVTCAMCNHVWFRRSAKPPRRCPSCQSTKWAYHGKPKLIDPPKLLPDPAGISPNITAAGPKPQVNRRLETPIQSEAIGDQGETTKGGE